MSLYRVQDENYRGMIREQAKRCNKRIDSRNDVPSIAKLSQVSPVRIQRVPLLQTLKLEYAKGPHRNWWTKVQHFGSKIVGFFTDRIGDNHEGHILIDTAAKRKATQLRWTVGHEIGHAVLNHPGLYLDGVYDSIDAKIRGKIRRIVDIEAEADLFASYLIFPEGRWKQIVRKDTFDSLHIKRVHKAFDVSYMSAAVELTNRSVRPSALLLLPRNGESRADQPSGAKLRLDKQTPYIVAKSDGWREIDSLIGDDELTAQLLNMRRYINAFPCKCALATRRNIGSSALIEEAVLHDARLIRISF